MKRFIKGFFKLIFKIIALPFIVSLTVAVPFMTFLFGLSEGLCSIVAGLLALGGILLWVTGTTTAFQGIMLIVMGFLLSPFGLRAVVEWLIGLLDDVNCSLKAFVVS